MCRLTVIKNSNRVGCLKKEQTIKFNFIKNISRGQTINEGEAKGPSREFWDPYFILLLDWFQQ